MHALVDQTRAPEPCTGEVIALDYEAATEPTSRRDAIAFAILILLVGGIACWLLLQDRLSPKVLSRHWNTFNSSM